MQTNSESTFVKHESCDACGSSDANAVYSNGSKFCFACEKHTPAPRNNTVPFIKPERSFGTEARIDTPSVTLTKDLELERLIAKWAAAPASSIPEPNTTVLLLTVISITIPTLVKTAASLSALRYAPSALKASWL
jgi:hypothetical protein